MNWIDRWHADEDVAAGWLAYLGGEQTAADVAASMQVNEKRAWHALTRLTWLGRASYGSPTTDRETTWRATE